MTALLAIAVLSGQPTVPPSPPIAGLIADLDTRVRAQCEGDKRILALISKISQRLNDLESRKCQCNTVVVQVAPHECKVPEPVPPEPTPPEPEALPAPPPKLVLRSKAPCARTAIVNGKLYRLLPGQVLTIRPDPGTVRVEYGGRSYSWEPSDWKTSVKPLDLQ